MRIHKSFRTPLAGVAIALASFTSYGAISQWDRKGCSAGVSPDGEVTAGYYDPKTFELRETITIPKSGPPVIMRGRDAKGTEYKGYVRMYCEESVLSFHGKEKGQAIIQLSR